MVGEESSVVPVWAVPVVVDASPDWLFAPLLAVLLRSDTLVMPADGEYFGALT